jgi:ribose-phosphate pyrophosphokinase
MFLNCDDIAIVFKERDTKTKNQSNALFLVGEVKDKTALIVDDIVDTAGTMLHAAIMLKKAGAKKVVIAVTHGVFSGKAIENICNPAVDFVYCTDTIPVEKTILDTKKVQVISVANFLAEAIDKTHKGLPLASDLIL